MISSAPLVVLAVSMAWQVPPQVLSLDAGGEIRSEALPPATAPPLNRRAAPEASVWGAFASQACGENACYLLLRMHGAPVTIDRVRAAIPRHERGASLLDLKQAAEHLGAECTVIGCEFEALAAQPMPLLARLGSTTDGDAGHFVVVTGIDARRVSFIDGTTAMSTEMPAAAFARSFSGHALTVSAVSPAGAWTIDYLAIALGVVVACESAVLVFLLWKRR